MNDFLEGLGLGIAVGFAICLFLFSVFDTDFVQRSYEKMHKGEVQCIDTPDKKVYCYTVKK